MEFANHICENLRQVYPNDSFVAYANDSAISGNCEFICNMNGTRVCRLESDSALKSSLRRLFLSSANAIGDSALKSLIHRVVFESKSMSDSLERATHTYI